MINVIGKIELPPDPRRKKNTYEKRSDAEILQKLDTGIDQSVRKINARIESLGYSGKPLLQESGHINVNAYDNVHGAGAIEFDHMQVLEQKKGFYNTYKPTIQDKYGTDDQEKIIQAIEKEHRMRDGNLSEQALFVLLTKALGDRYIPMRSSEYDDFINGTDLLLIDTKTGAPICAFDKTVEGAQSRKTKKIERAKQRLVQNKGMRMKYGCTLDPENKKLTLGEIRNIPPLFLALDKKDLEQLAHTSDFDIDQPLSDHEKKTLTSLLQGVENDIHILEGSARTISYDDVKDFLNEMKERLT